MPSHPQEVYVMCSFSTGRRKDDLPELEEYLEINTQIVYNELHTLTMEMFINIGGCNEEERE